MAEIVRRAVVAAVVVAGATLLPSCSGSDEAELADIATPRSEAANDIDDLDPEVALERVHDALDRAGTFRVQGVMRNGSELDIRFVDGIGASGTIHDPDEETPVEILAVDGSIYVTGDKALLAEQIGEDIDDTVAGKWLELGPDSLERYEVFADGANFAEAVLPTNESMTMTGVRELNDSPVIGLMFDESDSTVWVSAVDEPVPVQLEEKGAMAGSGILQFSVPGGEALIIAPAEEEIVSLDGSDEAEDAEGETGDEGEDGDADGT